MIKLNAIELNGICRKNRVICLPISQTPYNDNVNVAVAFRALVDPIIKKHPELFPSEINNGYQMKDLYYSKKTLRKLKILLLISQLPMISPALIGQVIC